MKLRAAALSLSLLVLLTGCTPMLERSYSDETLHVQFSDEGNSAILRAETYQGLVSAILHLVSGGKETGMVRLYNYISVTGSADSDVDQACLEVKQQDPLGAYGLSYIKYDVTQTSAYYQVSVKLAYRRTAEQIKEVVSVTGSGAIPEELGDVFAQRQAEAAFRISYFTQEDSAQSIHQAVEAAYLALYGDGAGMPGVTVNLYPASGQQRLAEILLTWPESENQTP